MDSDSGEVNRRRKIRRSVHQQLSATDREIVLYLLLASQSAASSISTSSRPNLVYSLRNGTQLVHESVAEYLMIFYVVDAQLVYAGQMRT